MPSRLAFAAAVTAALAAGPLLAAAPEPPPPFEIRAGDPVVVTLSEKAFNGETFNVTLNTANADRLVLNEDIITRLGIEPAFFSGRTVAKIGPTTVLKGHNNSVNHIIGGVETSNRIVWFEGVNRPGSAGSIGPLGIPHDVVRIGLPGPGAELYSFPLIGNINSHAGTEIATRDYRFGLSFGVESRARYPVATAAAGAAIARALRGVLTTETWEEEVMLGITRPVRRVNLAKPLVIGPFSFNTIAVRVRDARDATGSGIALPKPPSPDDDPSEIAVTGRLYKGPQPIAMLTIPASALAACSGIEYAKMARQITLLC